MKYVIHLILPLCFLLIISCSNRQKKFLPEATESTSIAIIGGTDAKTEIVISDEKVRIRSITNFPNVIFGTHMSYHIRTMIFGCGQNRQRIGRIHKSSTYLLLILPMIGGCSGVDGIWMFGMEKSGHLQRPKEICHGLTMALL